MTVPERPLARGLRFSSVLILGPHLSRNWLFARLAFVQPYMLHVLHLLLITKGVIVVWLPIDYAGQQEYLNTRDLVNLTTWVALLEEELT
jgi:hypothetical protein